MRESGIFLHITSLPSRYGIGDLGYDLHRWIDTLAGAGQRIWQFCPLGPVGDSNSPYMTLSTFAGNPLLISPDFLKEWGYLSQQECDEFPHFSESAVEFSAVEEAKNKLFKKAFTRFTPTEEFERFVLEENYWLEDYVRFITLYNANDKRLWTDWPAAYKNRDHKALLTWVSEHTEEIAYEQFLQFMFHKQWKELQKHASYRGVQLFGDVPIYVGYNSADVWADQSVFELDKNGGQLRVGGVPPDYFSEDGQRWGNPLYDWDKLKETNYEWWAKRLKSAYSYCDIVRIDHFRALEAYWAIDATCDTAKVGEWVKGPGHDFFRAMKEQLGHINLIAEDLGIITDEVNELRDGENLPGMKVLQFAFDGNPGNAYLPFNATEKSVMYTGTHDNDTTVGWFWSLDEDQRNTLCRYLACDAQDAPYHLMREVMNSVSERAIFPLQDILYLGADARFNTPGFVENAWTWRVQWDQCEQHFFDDLRYLTETHGRLQ